MCVGCLEGQKGGYSAQSIAAVLPALQGRGRSSFERSARSSSPRQMISHRLEEYTQTSPATDSCRAAISTVLKALSWGWNSCAQEMQQTKGGPTEVCRLEQAQSTQNAHPLIARKRCWATRTCAVRSESVTQQKTLWRLVVARDG